MIKVTRSEQCLKKLNGEAKAGWHWNKRDDGTMVLVIGKLKVKMQFRRPRTPEQERW